MQEPGSITSSLKDLQGKEEDPKTSQQLVWDRFFSRLARLVRKRLPTSARRAVDEEDIALSTIHTFFEQFRDGRYPQLADRTDLWVLLARIATNKAIKQVEHEFAQKRGGGKVRGDSVFGEDNINGFDSFEGVEPSADVVARLEELIRSLTSDLDDPTLRKVATMRLSGYSNSEIAENLGVCIRTVERKLMRIRSLWEVRAET